MGSPILTEDQKMMFAVLASLFIYQAQCLPAVSQGIDWSKYQPRYPTVSPRNDKIDLPAEYVLQLLGNQEPVRERYPGYKKGTKSFAGECGLPGPSERIVGGEEATPHQYPWMAALFIDDKWFCGGTLISDQWVLTAGHCADGASSVNVMLGAHNVREDVEDGRMEIVSTDIYQHESYNGILIHNDIALIKLPEPIEFNDNIRPICLPSYSEWNTTWYHLDMEISGWGKPTDSSDGISPVLRDATVDTITNLLCALNFPINIDHRNICISGDGGTSTCNGDSGGPLEYLYEDGKYRQIGITSFGSGFGCEIGMPAAFTRVASFLEWIETHTGIAIDP